VFPEYVEGLKDLDGFSHVELVYFFHRASELGTVEMVRKPFLDSEPRGIIAIRHPVRPNPIGLSVVRLISVSGNILEVEGIDVLDGTPLLDIKPYIPAFHAPGDLRLGWTEGKQQIPGNDPE
jgi:tRNA-Thr(GGU) m(6)t(6)A37 methyltransferase TsaA